MLKHEHYIDFYNINLVVSLINSLIDRQGCSQAVMRPTGKAKCNFQLTKAHKCWASSDTSHLSLIIAFVIFTIIWYNTITSYIITIFMIHLCCMPKITETRFTMTSYTNELLVTRYHSKVMWSGTLSWYSWEIPFFIIFLLRLN